MEPGRLTPVEETSLLTVYARALDFDRPHPILGDEVARRVVDQVDYDFAGLGVLGSTERFVALRAKMLDDRIGAFVARHPDAVIVDLGAGLSSAASRVGPPSTVDWYSVDLPRVIALRNAVLQERASSHCIAASLADGRWVEAIPSGRPTFVVADGLFAFLTESSFRAVVDGIAEHFHSGVLAFYDYGRVSRLSRLPGRLPSKKRMARLLADAWAFDGFTDPRHLEGWNPRLRLIEDASALHEPEIAAFPSTWRMAARMSRRMPAIARKARVLMYAFGDADL
ncbi:class I SAM-dependent methyltransferase [Mycolicibacterium sediminis]|uniref:Putative O-methyltransferase Omt n=1 Tax=Mycolicibacterium sediminis TaxID=1286180 RepID=A0A7I7QS49_9MYCO|nr:class I SAM-dependent methyltransferase [Mycolicibacterium sediminis]BBY29219.1 putative O-methyltransferase Omt [Mycolicibacterium sediminis]